MARLSARDIQNILNQELQWCKENPPHDDQREYARGYIAGTERAMVILLQVIWEMEQRDNRNRR